MHTLPETPKPTPRFIVSIVPDGEEMVQCIRVAHPSHLYLTDDYIPTHNTYGQGLTPTTLRTTLAKRFGKAVISTLERAGILKIHATAREARDALNLARLPFFSGKTRTTLAAETARWKKELDGFAKHGIAHVAKLAVPAVLRELGVSEQELSLTSYVVRGVAHKHPEITVELLQQMPAMLARPLFVYPHRDVKAGRGPATNLNVITDAVDMNGKPVLAALQIEGGRINTIFGVDESWEGVYTRVGAGLRTYPNAVVYAREKENPSIGSGTDPFFMGALSKLAGGGVAAYNTYRTQQLFHDRKNVIDWAEIVKKYGAGGQEFYQSGWHGSPHKFDEFSLDAIGKGEGAQVHGWGLYALRGDGKERKAHADKNYRARLLRNDASEDIVAYIATSSTGGMQKEYKVDPYMHIAHTDVNTKEEFANLHLLQDAIRFGGDLEYVAKGVEKDLAEAKEERVNDPTMQVVVEAYELMLTLLKNNEFSYELTKQEMNKGQLFRLELPDDDVLLDEDKKFNDQPEKVKKALEKVHAELAANPKVGRHYMVVDEPALADLSGKSTYSQLKLVFSSLGSTNPERAASEFLFKHGIQGIAYDGGVDGQAMVVFDPRQMKIQETFYQQRMNEAQGFFDGHAVHLIADNIATNEVQGTTSHEFFHKAMQAMGFDLSVKRVEDIQNPRLRTLMARLAALEKNPDAAEWFKRARAAVPEEDRAHPLKFLNEIAAYAVTQYENEPRSLPQSIVSFVKALLASVRAFLAEKFPRLTPETLTPEYLTALARAALTESVNSETVGGVELMFTRRSKEIQNARAQNKDAEDLSKYVESAGKWPVMGSHGAAVSNRNTASPYMRRDAAVERIGKGENTATHHGLDGETVGGVGMMFARRERAWSKQTPRGTPVDPTSEEGTHLLDRHRQRLGDLVRLELKAQLSGDDGGAISGRYTPSTETTLAMIGLAMNANSRDGTLAHEDWHAVEDMLREMGAEGEKLIGIVHRASSTPIMTTWLARQLVESGEATDSAAVEQLKDPSERAAYAFQFFIENEGRMPVTPEPRGVLEALARLIKKIFGITDDLVKTGEIFKLFDTGAFLENHENPHALVRMLNETRRELAVERLTGALRPLQELAFKVFGFAADRIHALHNPVYSEIVRKLSHGGESSAGYIREQRARAYQFMNEWSRMRPEEFDKLIERVERYVAEAGIERDKPANLPIVFDAKKIEGRLKEFRQDLLTHGLRGEGARKVDEVINEILLRGYAAGYAALFDKSPRIGAKWANVDINAQAVAYIERSTKSAEHFRLFGKRGIKGMLEEGDKTATVRERKLVRTYVDAAMGNASLALSPELRTLFGALITAVNLSLLPFSLFSQMVEPLQLAFRRNGLGNAVGDTFRGIRDLLSSGSQAPRDQWERISRDMGTVTDAQAISMMSQVMNEIPLRGRLHKLNQMFFRFNGMEQWNRSMHTAATKNAIEFIAEHAKQVNENSDRLLAEIGLKREDVKFSGGLPDYSDPKVRAAILRFVNEAMAQPDASSNALWMNDPRFALLAHLKRFTFGFSYYINRRAWGLLRNKQFRPLLPLALMLPWSIATMGMRDTVTPASEAYKAGWGVSDYVLGGIERTGLMGRASFVADLQRNVEYGGSGIESMAASAELTSKVIRQVAKGNYEALLDLTPAHQFVV